MPQKDFEEGLDRYREEAKRVIAELDAKIQPRAKVGLFLAIALTYYSRGIFTSSSEAVKDAWESANKIQDRNLERNIAGIWFGDPYYTSKRRF